MTRLLLDERRQVRPAWWILCGVILGLTLSGIWAEMHTERYLYHVARNARIRVSVTTGVAEVATPEGWQR